MREVEKVATIKSIEQRRGLLNAQTIPPHVRKFGGARKRFDGAREDAEPAKRWRFFARSKKCLQAETDAKKRNTASERLEQSRAEIVLVQSTNHGSKVADARKNDRRCIRKSFRLCDALRGCVEPLQCAFNGRHVARTVVNEGDVHNSSLVLGKTFLSRLSRLTAKRSARAKALNIASIWWCEDRPYKQRRCTLARAACANPTKKSSRSSTVKSPTRSALITAFTTQYGRPLRSIAAAARVSSMGIRK